MSPIPANPATVMIITSTASMAAIGMANLISLGPLETSDAVALLETFIGERTAREPEAARLIAEACAGLPVALTLIAARLRRQPHLPLQTQATHLQHEQGRLQLLSDRDRILTATFAAAVGSVDSTSRRVFLVLAALDVSDIDVPLTAAVSDLPQQRVEEALGRLEDQQLLGITERRTYRMHDLLRIYGKQVATVELGAAEIASAQERRVRWLVQAAREPNLHAEAEER